MTGISLPSKMGYKRVRLWSLWTSRRSLPYKALLSTPPGHECPYFLADDSNLQIIRPTEGVFHARVSNTYLLTYYDAQRVCELLGATLATYSQLSLAWEAGLEWCQYVNKFHLYLMWYSGTVFLFVCLFVCLSCYICFVFICIHPIGLFSNE